MYCDREISSAFEPISCPILRCCCSRENHAMNPKRPRCRGWSWTSLVSPRPESLRRCRPTAKRPRDKKDVSKLLRRSARYLSPCSPFTGLGGGFGGGIGDGGSCLESLRIGGLTGGLDSTRLVGTIGFLLRSFAMLGVESGVVCPGELRGEKAIANEGLSKD